MLTVLVFGTIVLLLVVLTHIRLIYLHIGRLAYIKFETSCKYGPNYSSGNVGNYVVLDNINVFNVTPCTYYGIIEDYSFDGFL